MSTSLLSALGYQVLSLDRGVYVLQTSEGEADDRVVGLMLTDGVPTSDLLQVSLFLEPVPEHVAAVDIVEVWQDLNARRFQETGLTARVLELGPLQLAQITQTEYVRPAGGRRLVLELPTGDVVCLN